MSPPEKSLPPAKDISLEGSDAKADKQYVPDPHQSLFIETLDPRFRPNLKIQEPIPALQGLKDIKVEGPVAQPANPLLDNGGKVNLDGTEGSSIFKNSNPGISSEEYFKRQRDWHSMNPSVGVGYNNNNYYLDRSPAQSAADRAADTLIFPGFGRFEGKSGGQDWRLDYLYSRGCRFKGVGICFNMKLP